MADLNSPKILSIMSLIFLALFTISTIPAFGQELELTNIHTTPSNIHVGDSFQINATIVNNSLGTIYFNGGCMSPLSTIFDKNIEIGHAMGCFAIYIANLKPGENTTIVGPSNNILYVANSTGTTNAKMTFSYTAENKSQNAISKLFSFNVSERASIPEFPSLSIVIFALSTLVFVVIISRRNPNLFKL